MSRYENHIETGLGKKKGLFKIYLDSRHLYTIRHIGSRKYLKLFAQTFRYFGPTLFQHSFPV
jgi:hypothetical protein